jgi:acyl-CoA reductase-like NAD-dependent aldehyde dehydrogenase
LEDSKQIMQSDEIKLILSTGGPGMVKASYSAGKPAIGVGSGNAPVLVSLGAFFTVLYSTQAQVNSFYLLFL